MSDKNQESSSCRHKKKKKKKRRDESKDRSHRERQSTLTLDKHYWKGRNGEERRNRKNHRSSDQDGSPHRSKLSCTEDHRQLNGHSGTQHDIMFLKGFGVNFCSTLNFSCPCAAGNGVNHYKGYVQGFYHKELGAQIKYGDLKHTSSNNSGKIFLCGGDNGETGPVPCRCK